MKMLYLFKKINLQSEYKNVIYDVKNTKNMIDLLEEKYNYVDNDIQEYYAYELIILKEKYKRMLNNAKNLNKKIEKM